MILRLRVRDYRAGELEARYPRLAVEEDYLVNYGFLPREHLALLHPRPAPHFSSAARQRQVEQVLAFVREQGSAHPAQVAQHFAHGQATNAWGGQGHASTQLLDTLHYRGLLRIQRRERGIRVYQPAPEYQSSNSPEEKTRRATALLALILRLYAPLPDASFGRLASLLNDGAPHLRTEIRASLAQLRKTLPQARIDGTTWYWPEGENPRSRRHVVGDIACLLAPFDPLVWDRRRFALFWGWQYRLEAYTPAHKRQYGYYALPLLWRDAVIGWGNLRQQDGALQTDFGFISGKPPKDPAFKQALEEELQRMHVFLTGMA